MTLYRVLSGIPGRGIYDWRHYLAVLRRKPGAFRNGAPFVEMPDPFRQLQNQMMRKPGGDREMVDILSLVLHHDEQDVPCAVQMALEAGMTTKTHVLNPSRFKARLPLRRKFFIV